MFLQDAEPPLHQFVIVRFVAGGALEFGYAGCFGKCNPDFGDKYAFQIETGDVHIV